MQRFSGLWNIYSTPLVGKALWGTANEQWGGRPEPLLRGSTVLNTVENKASLCSHAAYSPQINGQASASKYYAENHEEWLVSCLLLTEEVREGFSEGWNWRRDLNLPQRSSQAESKKGVFLEGKPESVARAWGVRVQNFDLENSTFESKKVTWSELYWTHLKDPFGFIMETGF